MGRHPGGGLRMPRLQMRQVPWDVVSAGVPPRWAVLLYLLQHRDRRVSKAELQHYEGQYVAIYQDQVVDSDLDKVALALRVYHKYGCVPIYVHHVSRHEPRTRYIHSPHLLMPH
jgi:hypothetical protein